MLDVFAALLLPQGIWQILKRNSEDAGSFQNPQLYSNFQIELGIISASFLCPA